MLMVTGADGVLWRNGGYDDSEDHDHDGVNEGASWLR